MKSKAISLSVLFFSFTILSHAQTMFDTLNSPTENNFIVSSFINDDEGWIADDNATLWHTADAGQSWHIISAGKYFLKIDFTDALNGFALGQGEAYKTTDGGITWESLPLNNLSSSLFFLNKNTGFISGDSMIYPTTDNGVNWTSILIAIPSISDYYFIDESIGVATSFGDEEEYKSIWRTSDGGLTWKNVYNIPNYYMYSVWFINESVGFAVGYYDQPGWGELPAINKTTDGGITWENIYKNDGIVNWGEPLIAIRFQDEQNGFALGSHGESVFTTDGGNTWNRVYDTDTSGLSPAYGTYKTMSGVKNLFLFGANGKIVISK